jgi:hypothetical protein
MPQKKKPHSAAGLRTKGNPNILTAAIVCVSSVRPFYGGRGAATVAFTSSGKPRSSAFCPSLPRSPRALPRSHAWARAILVMSKGKRP